MKKTVCLLLLLSILFRTACAKTLCKRYIALTFDDGPSGAITEKLLDGLEVRQVQATFFVCAYRVERYPEILVRMAEEGHEIGLHSCCHTYMQKMSKEEVTEDLTDCRTAIVEACGVSPVLFRPPGGLTSEAIQAVCREENLSVILWSVDPCDWDKAKYAQVLPTVLRESGDGSIILMHDLSENSVAAALAAIDRLQAEGYRFCTVSELAKLNAQSLQAGQIYSSFHAKKIDESGKSR